MSTRASLWFDPVRVLLPPSAGKAEPPAFRAERGWAGPVDLDALAFAERLTKPRERLLRALRLTEAPAAPAADVYTGVLFGQLQLASLDPAAWDRVLIASALFGAVAPGDRICAYRLDMGSKVPRLRESLAAFWRPALTRALPDEPGLLLDLRSGSYAAAWRPRRATVLGVRGFTEGSGGERTVITHMAKRVRGDVARIVLSASVPPETPEDVAALAGAAGLRVELTDSTLDVIE